MNPTSCSKQVGLYRMGNYPVHRFDVLPVREVLTRHGSHVFQAFFLVRLMDPEETKLL
jgi:hypothetical protein